MKLSILLSYLVPFFVSFLFSSSPLLFFKVLYFIPAPPFSPLLTYKNRNKAPPPVRLSPSPSSLRKNLSTHRQARPKRRRKQKKWVFNLSTVKLVSKRGGGGGGKKMWAPFPPPPPLSFQTDWQTRTPPSLPALPTGSKKGGGIDEGGEGEKEEKRQVDKNFFVIVISGAVVLIYDAPRAKAGGTFFALYARASKNIQRSPTAQFSSPFCAPNFLVGIKKMESQSTLGSNSREPRARTDKGRRAGERGRNFFFPWCERGTTVFHILLLFPGLHTLDQGSSFLLL